MGTRPRFWAVLGLLRQSLPGADSGAGAAANSFLRAAGCGLRAAGCAAPVRCSLTKASACFTPMLRRAPLSD